MKVIGMISNGNMAETTKRSDFNPVELVTGPGAVAFSTTRGDTAVAGDPYSGFNACHYTSDDQSHVAQCRQELAEAVGLPESNIVIPRQTHSVNVAVVDSVPSTPEDVDGLVTVRDDVLLCVNTADCLPVVFHDPSAKVIGIAHAGWKGVFNGIIPAVIEKMKELGADQSAIRAAMGPCICVDCYEVDVDFAKRFIDRFPRVENIAKPSFKEGKMQLDLSAVARYQLIEAGITADKINMPAGCTRCRPDRFFSARALGVASGRVLTAIRMLRDQTAVADYSKEIQR